MNECPRCGLVRPTSELSLCPGCFLTEDDSERPEAPPGFVLEQEIGRGGMGRVFRARQLRLDRWVAVKYLPVEALSDPSSEARFEREARTLARLSHPNIVAIHDFGILESKQPYLIMEYVAGGSLREQLPFSESRALRVALELCRALACAHAQSVVHRDIKPDNVLFDAEGNAKLADFGIARSLGPEDLDPLTGPLHVFGTPGFVAPEALTGAPPAPAMDVYALGVLMRVMVTGCVEPVETTRFSPPFAECVRHATASDPGDRPRDARALLSELERLSAALSPVALRDGARLEQVPGRKNIAPELPADEKSWQRAVALILSGATALSLHALLISVTPRSMDQSELSAFLVFGAQTHADGRVVTQARFETIPTLVAAGGWAVAFFAYGLLRRHWRREKLEEHAPSRPLEGTRALVLMALVLNGLFALRLALGAAGAEAAAVYLPVVGGVLELVMLYVFWSAILEALRTHRPLSREPLLWAGLVLSVLPPLVSFVSLLRGGAL